MITDQRFIERAEATRDLRNQLGSLGSDESEIQFMEWSPGRKLVTIWSMETGEEATLPRYQAVAAINTVGPRGGYVWTSKKENAPTPRINTIKCFLHPDSPERGFLDEIGVTAVCLSAQLASNASKWEHARNRHGASFKVYQEEIGRIEREEAREEQRKQTDAMLSLAGQNVEAKRSPGRPRKEEPSDG